MKQIEKDKLCVFCLGCNLLECETFEGVRNCKIFAPDKNNWIEELYKEMKDKET